MDVEATKLTTEVANLLLAIESFAKKVVTLLQDASKELNSWKQSEIKNNTKVKFAHQDFVKTAERAITYINRVEDLLQYGHKQIHKVIASLETVRIERVYLLFSLSVPAPEYQPLKNIIDQLIRFLVQTEELYQEFKEASY